ncbi:ABC-three component system protein [Dyella flagellata]|uniref:FAD dependent oxidoreductase n=1 Tax=Dyella flagellata TaxID=1867833 RepID=A0ABQ5X873_9GAMM|nr:ABC-three component system protein [Dyella flagellata]GLQ87248.1 hypothetical protein GCM10007898_08140 [Dyella flagellata]
MASIELSPEELISAATIPGKGGLYFLGPFTPRITFFSQQVRALRLARALHELGYFKSGQGIGVVGAGAAGATMAVALALLGHKVTLFDQSGEILHLQSGSTRLLHPHIYEWPQFGSLDDRAGLPILDWSAGMGKVVVPGLRTDFNTLCAGLTDLSFEKGCVLTKLEPSGKEWALTFKRNAKLEHRNLDHVFLTMGFGDELPCGAVTPEDYWKPGAIGTNATEAVKDTTYVVSGNGDGALTVILGLLIQDFEHDKFTREFLNFSRPDKLREAADKVYTSKALDADVEAELRTTVLPILSQYGVIETIKKKLRTDRIVTVNANGSLFAAGRASQLNQCMVLALLEAAEVALLTVARSNGFVTACTNSDAGVTLTGTAIAGVADTNTYKHAILRHGPNIEQRYSPAGNLIGDYEAHIKKLIATNQLFGVPPALDDETYDLFEAKRIKRLEHAATHSAALAAATEKRRVIEIAIDAATKVLVERGCRSVADIAQECEQLPERFWVDIHVAPDNLPYPLDLVRLARASGQKIELRAGSEVLSAWNDIAPGIVKAPTPSSARHVSQYGSVTIADYVDACLVRLLDKGIQAAIAAQASAMLGSISSQILGLISTTWAGWKVTLSADPKLQFDFLRWLANVEQQAAKPWSGDHGSLKHMVNALIMIAATHAGEPLTPRSIANGNLAFASNGVGIGTGCEGIGLQLLSSRTTPDDWDADALILAAANEVIVSDPAGTVMDGGDAGNSIKAARRVRPAIIQNDKRWRTHLGDSLASWKQAVELEFAEWRERQEKELKRILK